MVFLGANATFDKAEQLFDSGWSLFGFNTPVPDIGPMNNRQERLGSGYRRACRQAAIFNASLDKASVDNERNSLAIEMADGRQIAVVQIAGLVARRIVCWTKPEQRLLTGERFGLIRFGSRVDVYLPDGVAPLVTVGQGMIAGETVIADLTSTEGARDGRTA